MWPARPGGVPTAGHKVRLDHESLSRYPEGRTDEQLLSEISQGNVAVHHAPCADPSVQPVGQGKPSRFHHRLAMYPLSHRFPGETCVEAGVENFPTVKQRC